MLPKILIPDLVLQKLLSTPYIGDVVEASESLSLDYIQKIYSEKHSGKISDVIYKNTKEYSFFKISEEDEELFLHFAADRQQFKRSIIYAIIINPLNSLDLSENDIKIITSFFTIASLIDTLYICWRKEVVNTKIGKEFRSAKINPLSYRKEHGFCQTAGINTILQEEETSIKEKTLHTVFPQITKRISEELETLARKLLISNANVEMINYINALEVLYENDLVQNDIFITKAINSIWLNLFPRFVPIHGMSVMEDPGNFIVTPEISLQMIDKRYEYINEGVKITRQNLLTFLTRKYGSSTIIIKSIPLIAATIALTYTKILVGGRGLHTLIIGENPIAGNALQKNQEGRIFIDYDAGKLQWENEKTLLKKILSEEQFSGLYSQLELSGDLFYTMSAINAAGQEFSRNIYFNEDLSSKILTDSNLFLRECQAVFFSLASLAQNSSREQIHTSLLCQFASDISLLLYKDDRTKQSQYQTAQISLRAFENAKILTKHENDYSFHFTKESVSLYLQTIEQLCDELVQVYELEDETWGSRFIEKYFSGDAMNSFLFDLFNRLQPEK